MDTVELNKQLLAVGQKIKDKGWQTASVDIFVSYLAIFDRPAGPSDPMISYRPSIQATPHRKDGSFWGNGVGQQYVHDTWGVKSLEQAITKLHEAADTMPTMTDEAARIDAATGDAKMKPRKPKPKKRRPTKRKAKRIRKSPYMSGGLDPKDGLG